MAGGAGLTSSCGRPLTLFSACEASSLCFLSEVSEADMLTTVRSEDTPEDEITCRNAKVEKTNGLKDVSLV